MRRFVNILGTLAAVILAAVALLPWWLGIALAWIGPSFGMTFREYTRQGYARFSLQHVAVRRSAVTVKVDVVNSDTPMLWIWNRIAKHPGVITAGTWTVDVQSQTSDRPSKAGSGWLPLRSTLEKVADRLAFWLPRASAGAGVVTWPGQQLGFASVEWQNRTLASREVTYRMLKAAVRLWTPARKDWRVVAEAPDESGGGELVTKGDTIQGALKWWGQTGDVYAKFGAEGWRPTEAWLRSNNWKLPGDKLKLGEHYAQIDGDAKVEWRGGALTADVDVVGQPVPSSQAPPITVKLHGRGQDDMFITEAMQVTLPGIDARLMEPVSIDRHGVLKSPPSRFTVSADLSRQPWLQARGKLNGEGRITAGADGLAAVDFSVAGENVAVNQVEVTKGEATGRFTWPRLEITRGRLVMAEDREINVSGGWDFKTRELLPSTLAGTVARQMFQRWLPVYPQFGTMVVNARAEGRWPDIKHEGRASAKDVQLPKTNPAAVDVAWSGSGFALEKVALNATMGPTTIHATGMLDRARLRLDELSLKNGEEERLRLTAPVIVSWKPQLRIDPVSLRGPQGSVEGSVAWGDSGDVRIAVRHLESRWLRDVFQLPSTALVIDALNLNGEWAKGPASFSGDVHVSMKLNDQRSGEIAAQIRGGADGMEILSLRGFEGEGVIVDASGRLPVLVRPGQTPLATLDLDSPFDFKAATSSNPSFWNEIMQLTGVEIVKPEATARLEGTLAHPKGEVSLRADRLAAVPSRYKWEWPKIEALDVQLVGDPQGIKLSTFTIRIDGQLVRAEGTLPVSGERWRELIEKPRAFIQSGRLHVEVPDAEIAAIAHHFPEYFAPKGKLQIDLRFEPDQTISGFLKVADATSRPLGPLGVLQEINADVRFAGRSIDMQAVTARMGGQLVTLSGKASLPENDEPQLNFSLTGENLPFVRKTGLLVRGDLDLKLTSAGGRTAIGGNVRLRDSLFLADLASLIPTGAKESARRPPYFSVEAVPLNAWQLDVNVHGDKFMRLRTPIFNGTASAHFHLGGTLGVPRATGEAVVDEGNIRLPFASFEVRQGQVRLTPEQPDPQMMVNATTRRYGYDLRLELTGPATAPILTFSSSPPLEAEQVLLMVMAGEAPHNEIATTDRQRVARFGAFFGQSLLGSLGADSGGADRLTISSGENISAQGRETYSIEYKLGDKWALTGEYDEFDDYYGGVKWRFYQKGGKKADEKK